MHTMARCQEAVLNVPGVSAPVGTLFRVETLVGQAQAFNWTAGDEVLIDNLGGVFRADVAVPDSLGVDDDGSAVLALIEAAGLVDAHARVEAGSLDELLNSGVQLGLAVGVARGARGVFGAGVGADKYVAFKRGQRELLRSGDEYRVTGTLNCLPGPRGTLRLRSGQALGHPHPAPGEPDCSDRAPSQPASSKLL